MERFFFALILKIKKQDCTLLKQSWHRFSNFVC